MQKCNILFIIPTLTGGGAERVILTLIRHLDKDKFNASLVVLNIKHAAYLDEIPEDIELIKLESRRVFFSLPKLISLIWKRKPEIVFSTLSHLNLAIALIKKILPKNSVCIGRESITVSEAIKALRTSIVIRKLYRFFYLKFYSQLDLIICQSSYMKNDLVLNFKIPSEKIKVIYNPVDIDRINILSKPMPVRSNIQTEKIKLISAGRLTHQKGFDILLKAIYRINSPKFHLTILGDGEEKQDLLHLAKELQIESQITFTGFQKNPFQYYIDSHAFISCSRYEGLPNVILESLACGTPVIATPAPGGTKEILSKIKNCIVTKDISEESIAREILNFDYTRRIERSELKEYEIESIINKYEETFLSNVYI